MPYKTPNEYGLKSSHLNGESIVHDYLTYLNEANYTPAYIDFNHIQKLMLDTHSCVHFSDSQTIKLFCSFLCKALKFPGYALTQDILVKRMVSLLVDIVANDTHLCSLPALDALPYIVNCQASRLDSSLASSLIRVCATIIDTRKALDDPVDTRLSNAVKILAYYSVIQKAEDPYIEDEIRANMARLVLTVVQICDSKDNSLYLDMITDCMKIIRNLVAFDPKTFKDHIPILLTKIKAFTFCGLKNAKLDAGAPPLSPTAIPGRILSDLKRNLNQTPVHTDVNTRSRRLKLNCCSSVKSRYDAGFRSDGDQSSSDAESWASPQQTLEFKGQLVRKFTLKAFNEIIQVMDKKSLYSYWSCFLPHVPISPYPDDLFYSLCDEPVAKVRLSAIFCVNSMLEGTKEFLSSAEQIDVNKSSSFITFSQNQATMLKKLHVVISECLLKENLHNNTLQLLKLLTTLATNSPYPKLHDLCTLKTLENIKIFIDHKSSYIATAALRCLSSLINSCRGSQIIQESLNAPGYRFYDYCMQRLKNSNISPNDTERTFRIHNECVMIITTICTHHPDIIIQSRYEILKISENLIVNSDSHVQILGSKLFEALMRSLQVCPVSSDIMDLWQHCIHHLFPEACMHRSDQPININCLAGVISAMSTISSNVYDNLADRDQVVLISLILGQSSHEREIVRSAALRSLSIFLLIDQLSKNVQFIHDTSITIIESLKPGIKLSNMFRSNVSWSLSNLCQTLTQNRSDEDFVQEFPDSILRQLLSLSVRLSGDGSLKVKQNGVRSLGKLIAYADLCQPGLDNNKPRPSTPDRADEKIQIRELIDKSLKIIIHCITTGPVKLRWNACYAISEVLSHRDFDPSTMTFSIVIFTTLNSEFRASNNYKVKMSACSALMTSVKRASFPSSTFATTLESLMSSFSDFGKCDFDHYNVSNENSLISLVMISLMKMFSIIEYVDVQEINSNHFNKIADYIEKFKVIAEENYDEILLRALENVKSIETQSVETNYESNTNLENMLSLLRKLKKGTIQSPVLVFSKTYD